MVDGTLLPDPRLRGVIDGYRLRKVFSEEPRSFRVLPDAYVELLVWGDPVHIVEGGRRRRLPVCTAIGLLSSPLRLELPSRLRVGSVRIHGWAKHLLLGPSDPSASWFDARARFEGAVPAMVRAVRSERPDDLRSCFDATFLPRLTATEDTYEHARSVVSPRARPRALHRRQVERKVRAASNTSPKQLANLVRFQRARDHLWAQPAYPLAALARELGYADQPHFHRSFRRYAGMTPRQFLRACAVLRENLAACERDVAIVQD